MNPNELTLGKQIIFRLFGRVRIKDRVLREGGPLVPHYLARCKDHGPYVSYAGGHGRWLNCPTCFDISQNKGR